MKEQFFLKSSGFYAYPYFYVDENVLHLQAGL